MTCRDCELLLAQGERNEAVEEHLLECAECRALDRDVAANGLVLEALRNEELPRIEVKIPRPRRYAWLAVAAAAGFLIALLVPAHKRPVASPEPSAAPFVEAEPQEQAPQPPVREAVARRPEKLEPLKIKMLTPDPDVVIYWLIDN